jgi:hypothetical protein
LRHLLTPNGDTACITACGVAAKGTTRAVVGATVLIAEGDWMIGIDTLQAADTISDMTITADVDT